MPIPGGCFVARFIEPEEGKRYADELKRLHCPNRAIPTYLPKGEPQVEVTVYAQVIPLRFTIWESATYLVARQP